MSSYTFTFTGNSSELSSTFFPELVLDDKSEYSCALLELTTYHSIPNVTAANNKIYFYLDPDGESPAISDENALICVEKIPVGSYEAEEILEYIKVILNQNKFSFEYTINRNTFKTSVTCSTTLAIGDQFRDNILTKIFGFTDSKSIPKDTFKESNEVVKITSQDVVRVECNIVSGSYINGKRSQSIYEFATNKVNVGYKIIERPNNLIYLPVNTKRINFIQISFVDQNGDLIDFRGESITCRIHIKKK